MTTDLHTTNVLLGVLAAVSLLEAAAVIGVLLGAFLLYRRLIQVISHIEERQVAPAAARVNAILDDVKFVSSTVKAQAGHVDNTVNWAINQLRRLSRRAAERFGNQT